MGRGMIPPRRRLYSSSQPVVVAMDVEDRQITQLIGMREIAPHLGQMRPDCIVGRLDTNAPKALRQGG
jgi:hypothetical protein